MKTISVLFTSAIFLTSCSQATSENFSEAFPAEDILTIQTQGLEESSGALQSMSLALVGDRADLHDLSFAIAFSVNAHAHSILSILWFITRFEPNLIETDAEITQATWGPFRDNEGLNLEYVLHVQRFVDEEDGRKTYAFAVAGRTFGSQDEWTIFLKGGAKPFVSGHANRYGVVQLDLNQLRTLNPTEDDVGVFTFVYLQEPDAHAVAAVLEDVWADADQDELTSATYFYGRSSEGFAVLEFDTQSDIASDAGDAQESINIKTGWFKNGHGRADAHVTGGDLQDAEGSLTECWSGNLLQTYFRFTTQGLSPDIDIEDGDVANCVVQTELSLPEIDYEAIRTAFDN